VVTVCFVGTYPPIMCGIADFTSYIARIGPAREWRAISFSLDEDARAPNPERKRPVPEVWHGIPGPEGITAAVVKKGLEALGCGNSDTVLWFQHEFNIWTDSQALLATLRGLDLPKVVTLHTLHFQSAETPSGLCRREHDFLRALLPHVDAITVFGHGVCHAVAAAFPEHRHKVHVIRHGAHLYPEAGRLNRVDARKRLRDYLLGESGLDEATRRALDGERVFTDPDTVVIGQTGFLHPIKGSEYLFPARDALQELLPGRRVVALRIGEARQAEHYEHVTELRRAQNMRDKFVLALWLPQELLPVAQRAFDVNYYWPTDCTQSGILSHAFGAGALIAGRNLEGVGETLRKAGALCEVDQDSLFLKIRQVLLDGKLRKGIEQAGVAYAARYSWRNQAQRHRDLARGLFPGRPAPAASSAVGASGRAGGLLTRWIRPG
jgi:glycosyltransferase involved in cell wall biosynthesis